MMVFVRLFEGLCKWSYLVSDSLRVIVRWLSSFMVPSRFSRRPIRVSVVTF